MHYVHRKLDEALIGTPEIIGETIVESIEHEQNVMLFMNLTWEPKIIGYAEWLTDLSACIAEVRRLRPNWIIHGLVNSWWRPYDALVRNVGFDDVLYVDFLLYRTWRQVCEFKNSAPAYRWNADADKFLFLTGHPGKMQRIRLLHKYVKAGLIDHCEWSLHIPPDDDIAMSIIHSYVPELTYAELEEFLNQYRCNPDSIKMYIDPAGGFYYSGIPYNVKLFTKTAFSIVSETFFDDIDNAFITEKTWKAILNYHPFIMAGNTNSLVKLRNMGFVTYERFLSCQDYDLLSDPEQRLDAIVENTDYWLKNIKQYRSKIERIVLHNKAQMKILYQQNLNSIQNFINHHSLELDVDQLIPTRVVEAEELIPNSGLIKALSNFKFLEFYNDVKDFNWPQCTREHEFELLSPDIQQECIDVFGYVPKTAV
jgi:hypothetical protein